MDVGLVIRKRLEHLGFEQKDLAAAADVTESYISQLLTRKKLPPAPDRTDLYEKMGEFLKLSSGKLAKLAELQRREELKKDFEDRWFCASAHREDGRRYGRFSRNSLSVSSSASSPKSFWT